MELNQLLKLANGLIKNDKIKEGKNILNYIGEIVISKPSLLNNILDDDEAGECFLSFIIEEISDDIDINQIFSSLSYYYTYKALLSNSSNLNLLKNKLLVLNFGSEYFLYTVMNALELTPHVSDVFTNYGSTTPIKARDEIFKMEIAELELHPELCRMEFLENRRNELRDMITEGFFNEKDKNEIIEAGRKNSKKVYTYLKDKISSKNDIEF